MCWLKREYFVRHNNTCKYIHYKVLKQYDLEVGDNWFRHEPADVAIKDKVEVVYNQLIMTSRPVGANRPDILLKIWASPVDINVGKKD